MQLIESENTNEKLKNECALKQDELTATKASFSNQIENINEKLNSVEKENREKSVNLQNLQKSEFDLIAQVTNLNNNVNEYREKSTLLEQQNADLIRQLKQSESDHSKIVDLLNKQLQQGDNNLTEVNTKFQHMFQNFQQKINECEMLAFEKNELFKKVQDCEIQITQKNTQLNKQESFFHDHQRLQEESHKLKSQLNTILRDYESDNETKSTQIKMYQQKREEMSGEIDELKSKLRILEEKEQSLSVDLHDKHTEISNIQDLHAKEKEALNAEINMLKNEKNNITEQWKSVKLFNQKFEAHYELKKKLFKETEDECLQLKHKLGQVDKENLEMRKFCSTLEAKMGRLDEELKKRDEEINFLREKGKTLFFENQQIRSHKEILVRKLNETQTIEPHSVGGSLNSLNSLNCASNLINDNKQKCKYIVF